MHWDTGGGHPDALGYKGGGSGCMGIHARVFLMHWGRGAGISLDPYQARGVGHEPNMQRRTEWM